MSTVMADVRHLGKKRCNGAIIHNHMTQETVRQEIVEGAGMMYPIEAQHLFPGSYNGMMCIGTDEAVLDEGAVFLLVAHIEKEGL